LGQGAGANNHEGTKNIQKFLSENALPKYQELRGRDNRDHNYVVKIATEALNEFKEQNPDTKFFRENNTGLTELTDKQLIKYIGTFLRDTF
jgi:hypothetical protein